MADDEDNKRTYRRETVRVKARLLVNDQWLDCIITNISTVGARLFLRKSVTTDRMVRIQIADFGEYHAMVIWCESDETGLRFEHTPEEMVGLVSSLAS